MMDKFSVNMLRFVSFNSRGLNSDKKSLLICVIFCQNVTCCFYKSTVSLTSSYMI